MLVTSAQAAVPNGGPFNASFLEGGIGIERPVASAAPILAAGAPFTLSAWVRPDRVQSERVTLVALGDGQTERGLALDHGKLAFTNAALRFVSRTAVAPGRWTFVAATSDGHVVQLFAAGRKIASFAAPRSRSLRSSPSRHPGRRITAETLSPPLSTTSPIRRRGRTAGHVTAKFQSGADDPGRGRLGVAEHGQHRLMAAAGCLDIAAQRGPDHATRRQAGPCRTHPRAARGRYVAAQRLAADRGGQA